MYNDMMESDKLEMAYNFYNQELFGGKLPDCKVYVGNQKCFERGKIILNPLIFRRNLDQVLQELVHSMCHIKIDSISYSDYHDELWAKEMLRIGLIPTETGKVGGKQTGFIMSQLPEEKGMFRLKTCKLFSEGFDLTDYDWYLYRSRHETLPKPLMKYTCGCTTFFCSESLNVTCNSCGRKFVSVNSRVFFKVDKIS